MNRNLVKVSAFAAFAVGSLFLLDRVSAFLLLTPPRTWTSAPTYIVDQNGLASISDADHGATAVVNALNSTQAWNGASAVTVVHAVKGNTAALNMTDGIPMIAFRDPFGACTGNCLATTFIGHYAVLGDGRQHITDADTVTNLAFLWTSTSEDPSVLTCSNETYIEGVMVHEVGHGLGLAHTSVAGATMFPTVAACDNGPATTESDDELGMFALYGNAGHTVSNCAWNADIKESSGIFFSCPANKVMVGRRHSGDENGSTRYFCCNLGDPDLAAVTNLAWSADIKESNGTFFTCPGNQVLAGRRHSGDENGFTRYLCGDVVNDGTTKVRTPGTCSTTSDIKESSGIFLNCPGNQVMVGRRHSDDENGSTRYTCCNLQ